MRISNYILSSLHNSPVAVFQSRSTNVFQNIAFEDFLYRRKDRLQRVLFIWRNSPCIVIGRHQNPWLEINLRNVDKRDIPICRRYSGGGAVFHDLGNINLTFLTHRDHYKRSENLDFVSDVFRYEFDVILSRNKKDDLLIENEYKVSGTAAKLGLNSAYHHFTLLCNTNLFNLRELLHNPFGEFKTNATRSVPSKTKNIFTSTKTYDFDEIANIIGMKYFQYNSIENSTISHIEPMSYDKEIRENISNLQSYEWTYGKTPKFIYKGEFLSRDMRKISYELEVNKGMISKTHVLDKYGRDLSQMFACLDGVRFSEDAIERATLSTNYEFKHKYLSGMLASFPF